MAKKRRSAAQMAATRKLVALNKSKKRGKAVVKAKHKKRRRNPIANIAHHSKRRSTSVVRSSRRHKRRHNPIAAKFGLGNIVDTAMSGAIAAGGALTLDLAWGMLPIPEMLKVGPMRHAAKAAAAIGLGALAGMVVNKQTANKLALGALTVVMYNAAREVLSSVAPQIALGEYVGVEQPVLGEYLSGGDHQEGFDGLMSGENDYSMQGVSGSGFDF